MLLGYLAKRLLEAVLILFVTSIGIFSLLRLAPGDPASVIAGANATPEEVHAIAIQLGLDKPLYVQYFDWLKGLFTWHLGTSFSLQVPISTLIEERAGSTLILTISAIILMVVLGVIMGVLLAWTRSKVLHVVVEAVGNIGLGFPVFVGGVLLIFFFAVKLHLLPSGGDAPFLTNPLGAIERVVMPALALAIPAAPVIGRLLSTEMRRSADQEFVQTATAKGASRGRVIWRHVIPNSLNQPIIEVGIRIGHLLGGAVVTDAIFSRGGLGSLLIGAVQARDYPLAQVLLMLAIAAAIVVQLIAELVMGTIDPRIREGMK